jgi:hypothetical protein
MENNEELSIGSVVRPRAGMTRGVRIWPDPDGIFFCPFMEQGKQLGYIFVYGEEEPAVFDGKEWHPIMSGDFKWEDMQEQIVAQYYKIFEHAQKNPAYKAIAERLVGANVAAG